MTNTNKKIKNKIEDKVDIIKIEEKDKKPINNIYVFLGSFILSSIIFFYGVYLGASLSN